jgi:N-acyl homoserine lactone hydrolase
LRIHCLETGAVRPKRGTRGARRYLPGGWDEKTMPVNAFLVEHPAGLCLFDAGQSARAAQPGYFPRWHPFFRLARFELAARDEAAEQISRLGHEPGAVRWVVLSHLHTDHVGGLAPFTGAEVVVARTEWERATGLRGRLRGYLPQHWPGGMRLRLVDFQDRAVGPFSRSFDLVGDGRLLLVHIPGHTPGHTGLLARGSERSYLLGGDLAHSGAEVDQNAPDLAEFCRRTHTSLLLTHDSRARELLEAA